MEHTLKQQINLHGFNFLVASHCELVDRVANMLTTLLQLEQNHNHLRQNTQALIDGLLTAGAEQNRRIAQLERSASAPVPQPTPASAPATAAPTEPADTCAPGRRQTTPLRFMSWAGSTSATNGAGWLGLRQMIPTLLPASERLSFTNGNHSVRVPTSRTLGKFWSFSRIRSSTRASSALKRATGAATSN